MIDGVLYEVVVEAIRVSHDGRQDPMWNETLDYTSVDDLFEDLTSHCTEMIETSFQSTIAVHQNDWTNVPRWGLDGSRLEVGSLHVECRLVSCNELGKSRKVVGRRGPQAVSAASGATDGFWVMTSESVRCFRLWSHDYG